MRLKMLLGTLPNVGASTLITVGFFCMFLGLCWYVYRRDRQSVYEHLEALPLMEDN